jgi:hypothetical protein
MSSAAAPFRLPNFWKKTVGCLRPHQPVRIDLRGTSVSRKDMLAVYEQVKTPYKYGIVIEPPEGKMVDGPSVFRHQDRWYMVYFQLEDNPVGYTTHLAVSDDLLHWTPNGVILPRGQEAIGTALRPPAGLRWLTIDGAGV